MLRGLDGDRVAYAALLTALGGHLRGYLSRRLANAGDVEDLVQETLLVVHEKRHTYLRDQPLTPWVFAIARYKLLSQRRRAYQRPSVDLEAADEVGDPHNPEEAAIRHDVRRLLSLLPGRQRRLVEDTKLTGLSVAEAAGKAGMSIGAVKVSIHRSLKALSQRVRDED